MRVKGMGLVVLVNLNQVTDASKPDLDLFFLLIRCATLCPTLTLQSLSEQAKCASPGEKGNALKNQTA